MHERLTAGVASGRVVTQEAWAKYLKLMQRPEHADSALQLMLQDAALREGSNWDWVTHGYGQGLFALIQVRSFASLQYTFVAVLARGRCIMHNVIDSPTCFSSRLLPSIMPIKVCCLTAAGWRRPRQVRRG